MSVANARRWTVAEVHALPEDPSHRYEVVDGELLVTPSARMGHQLAVSFVFPRLDAYVRAHRLGHALVAPFDVILDARTLLQPDLLVMPPVPREQRGQTAHASRLLLALEVLSPPTARNDRLRKRPRLQREGVECWLFDLDSQLVERWEPSADRPEICVERIIWTPEGGSSSFELDLLELWEEVGPTGEPELP